MRNFNSPTSLAPWLLLAAWVVPFLGACAVDVPGEGETDFSGGEAALAVQALSACSFPVTTNAYKGDPDYWGTIVVKNTSANTLKSPQISFQIPSGAKCNYDGSGWKHTQSGTTCTYSRKTSLNLKPGASYTFNFSTDSESSFTPRSVTIRDSSCGASPTPTPTPTPTPKPTPTPTPTPGPTVFYDFSAADASAFELQQPYGKITFGAADSGAHDDQAVSLLWKANTNVTEPSGHATEIGTNALLGFGEYRFRVRLAACTSSQELVSGLFTYQNDGGDHDGDGLIDNNEIDIEILCGQPNFINLTSYSQYTNDSKMRSKSRVIDLSTGTLYVGQTDKFGTDENDPLTGTVDSALAHPGWYDPSAYYEMGFDWQADHVRWFIVLDGKEITLWNFTDTKRIPQHPSTMRFNAWYPGTHWNASGTVTPPNKDTTLSVDWFSFTAGK